MLSFNMIVGGHVSIAGGIEKAPERARAQTFDALQIFVTSPRSFQANEISASSVEAFKEAMIRCEMQKLVFHAVYLVNLAVSSTAGSKLLELSKLSLAHYLRTGDTLGSIGTIVHTGSHKEGTDREENLNYIADAIDEILTSVKNEQNFIIENGSGPKKTASTLDELEYLYNELKRSERVRFCIDTQHLFASGVDLLDKDKASDWFKQFDQKIGIDKIAYIHVNDSKSECGSFLDRHENVGEGKLGLKGLGHVVNNPLLKSTPFILETPGFDGKGPDEENAEKLRDLVNS